MMVVLLTAFILGLSVPGGSGLSGERIVSGQAQNACCVLPNGQLCCSPTVDSGGRPNGCGC